MSDMTPTFLMVLKAGTCQSSKLDQALRHDYRLAQSQVEQVLDRKAEVNHCLAVLLTPAPLAAGTSVLTHGLVQPTKQGAPRLQRGVVVFPVGRSVLRFCWGTHAVSLLRTHTRPLQRLNCATKPSHNDSARVCFLGYR